MLVRGESLYETREVFGGAFSLHLDAPLSGGFFSTRECFLTLSRLNEDESWTMVWRGSKSSLPSSSPSEEVSLGQTRLSLASLCNGDVRRPLRLQLWEFHSDGRHDILGHVTTNTHSITASSAVTLKLSDDKDKTKQLGHVIARDCRIESAATFSQVTHALTLALALLTLSDVVCARRLRDLTARGDRLHLLQRKPERPDESALPSLPRHRRLSAI